MELLETFIYVQEDPFSKTFPMRGCAASAPCSVHQVIKVPVCQQKPNRHENPTVSTKDQRQTKPLVVSESELPRPRPVPLSSARPSFPFTGCPPVLSAIRRNIRLLLCSHVGRSSFADSLRLKSLSAA